MRKILMLAALVMLVLSIAGSATTPPGGTKELELFDPFACLIEKPDEDYVFDSVAETPGGNSSLGDCGMFWSNSLDWDLFANTNTCFTLTISKFKMTLAGIDYFLDSALDCVGGSREWWKSWFIWHDLDDGTRTEPLQVGVERNGFADRAGTYIATIEVLCEACVSNSSSPPEDQPE